MENYSEVLDELGGEDFDSDGYIINHPYNPELIRQAYQYNNQSDDGDKTCKICCYLIVLLFILILLSSSISSY